MLATTPDNLSGTTPKLRPDIGPPGVPQETHAYDVCFFLNRRRALHFLDRGVTLGADGLSCTADGCPARSRSPTSPRCI